MNNSNNRRGITMLIKPVSAACNLACDYCFYKDSSKQRKEKPLGVMNHETTEQLIERIFVSEPPFVSFVFQGGEPLLAGHAYFMHFTDLVNRINRKQIPIFYSIQTNGTLITEDLARFFREHDWLVGISLDGEASINNCARAFNNGEGSFQAVMAGIELLKKERVPFNILSVVTSRNYSYAAKTYSFFKKQGFDYLQFIPCIDFVHGENHLALSPDQWLDFQRDLFDLWYEDIIHGKYVSIRWFDNLVNLLSGHPAENCAASGFCGGYFVCESNGDIYPCDFYCLDEYKLGNIKNHSLAEMTQTETYRGFVGDSFLIHEKCSSCHYYRLCRGGCKKERGADLSRHLFCSAYQAFFDYSISRLRHLSEKANNGQLDNLKVL